MKTILITGANGFIARHLAPVLKETGARVIGTTRSGKNVLGYDAIYVLSLGESLKPVLEKETINIIIHTAFDVYPGSYALNIEGTSRWLEEAHSGNVPLQIFLSTLSAEADALSEYGQAKYALEQRVLSCNGIVFRLGLVIGDGGLFARLRETVRRSPIIPMLNGGNQQVYILGISTLCNILCDCVINDDPDLRGKIWQIHQPRVYRMKQVLQAVRAKMGHRRILLPIPARPVLWAVLLFVNSLNVKGLIQRDTQDAHSDFARFGYPEEGLMDLL
jgi:nucleoside-diphosphate-sugar epimerase